MDITTTVVSLHLASVSEPTLTLSPSAKQLMVAVGDSGGTLHILEVPWSLSHASHNEVASYPI